jgi:predicted metal-dependent phosphoesterase TrpH
MYMDINVELHTHTYFSKCGNAKLEDILNVCEKQSISAVAITDHDTLQGAFALKEKAPNNLQVIIGEEITTIDGEIIGLFLHKEISGKNKSVEDVIKEIKSQNGLVYVPHPFDKFRKGLNFEKLNKIVEMIDIFEIYNSRCLLPKFNRLASEFAQQHNLLPAVGSDAHTISEFGKTTINMAVFNNKEEFMNNLKYAKFKTKYSSPFNHVKSLFLKKIDNVTKN